MDESGLIVSLPEDASLLGNPSRRDLLLAAVSLPEPSLQPSDLDDVNLDESRSESSKTSAEPSGGIGGVAFSSSSEPSPDDDDGDLVYHYHGGSKGAGVMKRAWQPEEDEHLMKLVTELGPCHWSVIASHLDGRVGKQCRERCAPSDENFRSLLRTTRASAHERVHPPPDEIPAHPPRARVCYCLAAGTTISARTCARRSGPRRRITSSWIWCSAMAPSGVRL